MPRLNLFENLPVQNVARVSNNNAGTDRLHFQLVDIPGSISFNNVAMQLSASITDAATITISFGLYSLNGSTLSLANSASFSSNFTTTNFQWISLITSATQDITPGNWWFAIISATSSNSRVSLVGNSALTNPNFQNPYIGPFFRGYLSTTNALPSSIVTDFTVAGASLRKEGASAGLNEFQISHPYILISA